MCGISGFFSHSPVSAVADGATLLRMQHALAHRGPDGSGTKVFAHAALAHNRLAIIDLDAGMQPLSDPSGAVTICFNGEIYNFRQLREKYRKFPYRTQSDTEVIIAIYMCEGVEGMAQLRGMYSIALWDETAQKGWLLRDPVGIKPLFYAEAGDRLYFASEGKALLASGAISPSLDSSALHQLLNFRYVTGTSSLFNGISQLAPGEVFEWSLNCSARRSALAFPADADTSLTGALAQAVSRHLVADVKVGCYLSGGLDSALIASIAAKESRLETYTLDVGDDPLECRNAAETAAMLGLPNAAFDFAMTDVVGFHQSMVRHLEAPKVNAVQSAILAEHTATRTKVALSGLGGDELFLGYNAHRIMWAAQLTARLAPFGCNRFLANTISPVLQDGIPWGERNRAMGMLAAIPAWSRVYGILRNVWDSPTMRRAVYGQRLLDARPQDSFAWLLEQFPKGQPGLEAMRQFEFRNKMVNDLLWNEDRVSMRVGLEVRVPFLDWDLVAACQQRTAQQLMPFGRAKHALKRLAVGIVPDRVIARRKSGFQLDVVDASGSTLAPLFKRYLSEDAVDRHRLFNFSFVKEVMQHRADRRWRWHYFLLYLMAQTHIFMDEYDLA